MPRAGEGTWRHAACGRRRRGTHADRLISRGGDFMKIHRFFAAAAGVAFAASSVFAQSKPTVAIMYFNDGAIGKAHEELAPLSKGIADVLITEMADNPGIKVVERDQLQSIL